VQCLPRPALPRPLSAGKGRGKAAPAAAAAAAGEAKNIASSQAFNLLCAFFNLLLLCLQRANVLLRFIYPHPSPFASAAPPRLNPYLAIQSKPSVSGRTYSHANWRRSIIPRPRPSPRSQPSGIPASAFVVNNFFSLLGARLLQLECVLSAQRYKRYISREQPT